MGVDEDYAARNFAVAGDDRVAEVFAVGHAEFGGAVFNKGVEFLKSALVEEEVDALACGELALGVLSVDARRSSALPRLLAESLKLLAHHVDFAFENHAAEPALPLTNFEQTRESAVRSMGYNGRNHTTKSPRP